jgi:DNA replication regulator SLD3
MLLPREHLSLANLDLLNPSGTLPLSAVYESNIRALDLEGRLGCSVLLARAETTATVYALEQQEKGKYFLCKLVSAFDVRDVMQLATTIYRPRLQYRRPPAATGLDQVATTTPQLHKENKKKRLAIEQIQSMVRKRPRSPSVALPHSQELPQPDRATAAEGGSAPVMSKQLEKELDADDAANVEDSTHAVGPAATVESAPQPGAEDIFQNIRTQYFEALYHSKVVYRDAVDSGCSC